MKKLLGLVLGGLWLGLTLGAIGNLVTPAHAQSVPPISPFVYTSSSSISTLNSSTVTVKGLGGVGTKCLQVNNSGTIQNASGACGTGGGASSTVINGATSTNQTIVGGTGNSVATVAGATNSTTTITNIGVLSLNGATGTITIATSSNNATGTIDGNAVFNATNTLISTQPFTITPTLLSAGCVGSSTATTINGCVQAIVANQLSVASGTSIIFSGFFPQSVWTTAMNLNTNNFPVQVSCTAGTVMQYGGVQANASSGAVVFNFLNGTGHQALAEFAGCNLWGHPSLLAAGATNTATTTGVYFGGNFGAVGINFEGNLNGFGINYVMGLNAYMDAFTGTSSGGNGGVITVTGTTINGSTTITGVSNLNSIPLGSYLYGTGVTTGNGSEVLSINAASGTLVMSNAASGSNSTTTISVEFGSLGQYDTANNSGERPLLAGTYTDPGNASATDALFIADAATADWFCNNISLDDAQIHGGFSEGLVTCTDIHIENSDYPAYGNYIPIYFVSSQYTMLSLSNIQIAQDSAVSSTGFTTIVKHGVELWMNGVLLNNYGGGVVQNLVDHSLNNGAESEQICDVQVGGVGAGLTNIVAGNGGNLYTQAAGVGCSIDTANSYTIEIIPEGSNTNQIMSGNNVIATFDHSGNWTMGVAANSGFLAVQGGINATGTITQNGSAVAVSAGNGVNGDCAQFTGGNTITAAAGACGTGSAAGTVTTSTAMVSGQIAVSTGGTAVGSYNTFTFASSTGLLSAPTGTFSGTLTVSSGTYLGGILNVTSSATFQAAVTLAQTPTQSTSQSLLSLTSLQITGGGDSASGTYIGANAPNGNLADFINFMTNGSERFQVEANGKLQTWGDVSTEHGTLYTNNMVQTGGTMQLQNGSANNYVQGNLSVGTNTAPAGGGDFYSSGSASFGTSTSAAARVTVNGLFALQASSTILTPSISGAIVGLGCDTATSSVDASITSSTSAFITTPTTFPGAGLFWQTYLSAAGLITTEVCSDVTVTPTASTYVVKIVK